MTRATPWLLALTALGCGHPTARRDASAPRATVRDASAPPPPLPRDACTDVPNALGLRLARGFCLHPVATGLLRPREMALAPDGAVLVAESGPGWSARRGRVSVLRAHRDAPTSPWSRETLVEGVDRPHGIAFHDGAVWVAEAGRIASTAYPPAGPAALTARVADLPMTGRHPRKTLAFGPDGWLYFSVGSATDNCVDETTHAVIDPCVEAESDGLTEGRAMIRRWNPATPRHAPEVFARGLRNTLGLAWHPASGRLYGVENSRDYIDRADPSLPDATLPHDELNEIVRNTNHGWPYCYDDGVTSPEYRGDAGGARCTSRFVRPAALLPPHAAAIGITFYTGAMFPGAYRGRALVALHGYRAMGHRVVSIPFTPTGDVAGPPEDLVAGWEERPGRAHGHLTSLLQLPDGSVLLSDDVSGVVYRIAWGESAARLPPPPPPPPPEPTAVVEARCAELARQRALFARVQREVLDAKCVPCHGAAAGGLLLRRCDWRGSWETLLHGRSTRGEAMVSPGDLTRGELMARLRGDAPLRMPPPGVDLSDAERALIERWVREGASPP